MGLTVSYTLRSLTKSRKRVLEMLERAHVLARTLPFDEVHDIQIFDDVVKLNLPWLELRREENLVYASVVNRATVSVRLPWSVRYFRDTNGTRDCHHIQTDVRPDYVAIFTIELAEGSESVDCGLAHYPKEIQVEWTAQTDAKYMRRCAESDYARFVFDWRKYQKDGHPSPEMRTIRTHLHGWYFRDFCKTQYASNPEYGGLPNFLRAHISLVTLLEALSDIPGLGVSIHDEAGYASTVQHGRAEPGLYSVPALARQVADGAEYTRTSRLLRMAWPGLVHPEIFLTPEFEKLVFTGSRDPRVQELLDGLRCAAGVVEISPPVACVARADFF